MYHSSLFIQWKTIFVYQKKCLFFFPLPTKESIPLKITEYPIVTTIFLVITMLLWGTPFSGRYQVSYYKIYLNYFIIKIFSVLETLTIGNVLVSRFHIL